jgi:hypothetical protein
MGSTVKREDVDISRISHDSFDQRPRENEEFPG